MVLEMSYSPSIHFLPAQLVPALTGKETGCTLYRSAVYCRPNINRQPFIITFTPTANLESLVNLISPYLDCSRHRKNMHTDHTKKGPSWWMSYSLPCNYYLKVDPCNVEAIKSFMLLTTSHFSSFCILLPSK